MSQEEVSYLSEAYIKDYREKWEMLRFLGYTSLAPHVKDIKSPKDVMNFEWDNDNMAINSASKMTKEQLDAEKKRIIKQFNIV